jgi:hypothetical protein
MRAQKWAVCLVSSSQRTIEFVHQPHAIAGAGRLSSPAASCLLRGAKVPHAIGMLGCPSTGGQRSVVCRSKAAAQASRSRGLRHHCQARWGVGSVIERRQNVDKQNVKGRAQAVSNSTSAASAPSLTGGSTWTPTSRIIWPRLMCAS